MPMPTSTSSTMGTQVGMRRAPVPVGGSLNGRSLAVGMGRSSLVARPAPLPRLPEASDRSLAARPLRDGACELRVAGEAAEVAHLRVGAAAQAGAGAGLAGARAAALATVGHERRRQVGEQVGVGAGSLLALGLARPLAVDVGGRLVLQVGVDRIDVRV